MKNVVFIAICIICLFAISKGDETPASWKVFPKPTGSDPKQNDNLMRQFLVAQGLRSVFGNFAAPGAVDDPSELAIIEYAKLAAAGFKFSLKRLFKYTCLT